MNTLAADHLACAAILRRSGSSFALPIRLLPTAKRQGTTAIYAFCRVADDLVDEAPDTATAAEGLDSFTAKTEAALAGRSIDDPVLRALTDTVRRFAIPEASVREILAGVRMDVAQQRYATWADLERYCSRVASAVGVAAIHVWGFVDPAAVELSHDCGVAFQLTNILRDIPEDLGRGRIYLPQDDLLACGCTEEELVSGRIGPEFARLAGLEIDRAAACYRRAAAIDGMLSTDGRGVFRAMFGLYRGMLDAVRRAGPSIFTSRVRPSRSRLMAAAAATILLGTRSIR
jgi:phytoene synthase